MKKTLALFMIISLCTGLFCACTPQADPTGTDSSVQASTDTGVFSSSEADASLSDSVTGTNTDHTTDSSTGTETDTPVVPTPFPFADTVFDLEWDSKGYKVPSRDTYVLSAELTGDDSVNSSLKTEIELNLNGKGILTTTEIPNLSGKSKPSTFSPLSGKETIELQFPKIEAFTINYAETMNRGMLDSPHELIRKTGALDIYYGAFEYEFRKVDVMMSVHRETGILKQLFVSSIPISWFYGDTTQKEAEDLANKFLVLFYGKDALSDYTYIHTSLVNEGVKDATYCVVYKRMFAGYPTSEALRFYITKGGYFTGVSTFSYGLFADIEETLTEDRVKAAEKALDEFLPCDHYMTKIHRDVNGEYYLSALLLDPRADWTCWINIP